MRPGVVTIHHGAAEANGDNLRRRATKSERGRDHSSSAPCAPAQARCR
jgi:hypothetical protein